MRPDDFLGYAVVIALIIVPALAFTARFALKPMVESILHIRDSLDRERPSADDRRLTALEERVAGMEALLERVAQTVEFDARLRAGSAPSPTVPPTAGPRLVAASAEAGAQTGAPQRRLRIDPADFEEEYQ